MAACVRMSLSPYGRPGEMLALRRSALIAPKEGVPRAWGLMLRPEELGIAAKTE